MTSEDDPTRYVDAWRGLHVRIESGLRALAAQSAAHHVPHAWDHEPTLRRMQREEFGLALAGRIWRTLDDGARSSGDYAIAWQSFTDILTNRLRDGGYNSDVRAGLARALDYQSGSSRPGSEPWTEPPP